MAIFTCFGVRNSIIRRRRLINVSDALSVLEDGEYDHPGCECESEKINSFDVGCSFRVRKFTWEEMERVSADFLSSRVIGHGGFSTVYLATFSDSSLGAIKIYCSSSERLSRVFKQELEILLKLKHDHIVKLLGYCDEKDEGVLVFEYVSNGTLQEKLHGRDDLKGSKQEILSWRDRMVIAYQLAQAIEYLHEKCAVQIVHGDIKASKILLDENLNCKLCDFGSAKLGFSSAVLPPSSTSRVMMKQMMLGSPGYTDPHYMRTGLASKKNDIYSFGVILLELITGEEALSAHNGERLTEKARPILKDPSKVAEMVDSSCLISCAASSGGLDMEEEAKIIASLSAKCLSETPSLRPSASDIIGIMRNRIDSISSCFVR